MSSGAFDVPVARTTHNEAKADAAVDAGTHPLVRHAVGKLFREIILI